MMRYRSSKLVYAMVFRWKRRKKKTDSCINLFLRFSLFSCDSLCDSLCLRFQLPPNGLVIPRSMEFAKKSISMTTIKMTVRVVTSRVRLLRVLRKKYPNTRLIRRITRWGVMLLAPVLIFDVPVGSNPLYRPLPISSWWRAQLCSGESRARR